MSGSGSTAPQTGTDASAAVGELERALGVMVRLFGDRETVGDVADRAGHDLPPASWALLEYLEGYGPMRISDIAACHGVDVSSVTPRLKRLHNAGLIERKTLPADARASLISMTAQGRQALKSVHNARREFIGEAIQGVDAGHIAVAADVLAHLAERLANYEQRLHGRSGAAEQFSPLEQSAPC